MTNDVHTPTKSPARRGPERPLLLRQLTQEQLVHVGAAVFNLELTLSPSILKPTLVGDIVAAMAISTGCGCSGFQESLELESGQGPPHPCDPNVHLFSPEVLGSTGASGPSPISGLLGVIQYDAPVHGASSQFSDPSLMPVTLTSVPDPQDTWVNVVTQASQRKSQVEQEEAARRAQDLHRQHLYKVHWVQVSAPSRGGITPAPPHITTITPSLSAAGGVPGGGFPASSGNQGLLMPSHFAGRQGHRPHRPIVQLIDRVFGYRYSGGIVSVVIFGIITIFIIADLTNDRRHIISLLGVFILVLLGTFLSRHPHYTVWHHVTWGLILQFVFALLILRWRVGKAAFGCLGDKVKTFLDYTDAGFGFVVGYLVTQKPFNPGLLGGVAREVTEDVSNTAFAFNFVFMFKILSIIYFFSFCVSMLFYCGVMQWLVCKLGWLLQVSVGTTACESPNAAANIFLSQSESPLMIRPCLPLMTNSEIHAVMTGGFATIAGSLLGAYIRFGVSTSHLLSASVMLVPAALAFSKLFGIVGNVATIDITSPRHKIRSGEDSTDQVKQAGKRATVSPPDSQQPAKRPSDFPAVIPPPAKQAKRAVMGIPGEWLREQLVCIKFNIGRCTTTAPHPSPVGASVTLRHICGGCLFLKKGINGGHGMHARPNKNRAGSFC